MFNRRDALNRGFCFAALNSALGKHAYPQDALTQPRVIVDTNVSLFQWPFRRLPLDDFDLLAAKLQSLGVTQVWASSFEGLLQRNISAVNQRLAAACKAREQFIAIGAINLSLPDWEEDLRRCVEDHRMPGVRIYPNYHGYSLADPRFADLLRRTAAAKCLVQLTVAMEDTRTQNKLVQIADVNLSPLPELMSQIPAARVQLLNYRPQPAILKLFANTPGIYFDVARIEGTDGVPQLVRELPPGRVLYGSHAPFLIPEAALIRVHESGQLGSQDLRDLLAHNADRLLGRQSS